MKPIVAHKDPKLPAPLDVSEGPDWVETLSTLDPAGAQSLLVVMRTLCPHDRLPDRVYRRVVITLDRLVDALPGGRTLLRDFVAGLDAQFPVRFRDAAELYRVEMLKAVETTPAFRFVQRLTVRYLYDDIEVWQAFGYEGASVHLGGFAERGFDDLDWLPDPPASR